MFFFDNTFLRRYKKMGNHSNIHLSTDSHTIDFDTDGKTLVLLRSTSYYRLPMSVVSPLYLSLNQKMTTRLIQTVVDGDQSDYERWFSWYVMGINSNVLD